MPLIAYWPWPKNRWTSRYRTEKQQQQWRPLFLYFSDMVEKSKERYQEFTENPAQNDLAAKAIHALDKIS